MFVKKLFNTSNQNNRVIYIVLSSIVDRNSRFPKILDYFTFSNFRLFHETSALIFFAKLWNKKCKHFSKKRGEILTYNAELCTEVFSAITCCSYGFREIIFSRNFAKPIFAKTIISKFRIVFTKNAKFREKMNEIRTKFFAFFRESFRSLETLCQSWSTQYYPGTRLKGERLS